ncbi:MAG: endonuclease domain-containing protein [Parvibaculaceae bacterium]
MDAKQFARKLRKEQTDAERRLWWHLRNRQLEGWKFRRQFPIGGYIVDFACIDAKLIVELDGGQHSEQGYHDEQRTRALERAGFVVLRFWNSDVLANSEGVIEEILRMLRPTDSSPSP